MRHLLFFTALLAALASTLAGETLRFTDKLGRTIQIEVPVRRAVVFQLHDFLPVLRPWDRIVGLGRSAFSSPVMLAAKPDIATTIPSVGSGSDVNLEALLNLKPDVVLTWTYRPDVVRFLEQKGIKVIAVYPDSIREMYEVIELEGKLFGREKEAAGVIRQMNRIFDLVRQRGAKVPPQRRAKVLWAYGQLNSVGGGTSLLEDLIRMTGAVNVAGSTQTRSALVSAETVLGWNPEIAFVWGTAPDAARKALANPQWRSLKAVRDKRVFKVPEWSTWSPCLAPITLWMAVKTYPELYRDVDLYAVTGGFFRDVFGFPTLTSGRNDF